MTKRTLWIGVVAAALAAPACGDKKDETEKPADPEPVAQPEPKDQPPATEQPPAAGETLRVENADLATPESVLYVPDQDVYLVSNINGSPLDADGNGFISRVSPDGKVVALKWIDGTAEGVTLNAPKGTAIAGGTLYVADIDHVRMFDATTGAPRGEIAVEGATFLNDVAAAGDRVYVSDTGMKASKSGFEPSGSAAVYAIAADGSLEKLASGDTLNAPNGLAVADQGIWVVTFGSNELYRIDEKGTKTDVTQLPKGQLDGVVVTPGGDVLVSSWEGKAVYRGKPGGTFTPVVENIESPADIGYDSKRDRLLVPAFMGNAVTIEPLAR